MWGIPEIWSKDSHFLGPPFHGSIEENPLGGSNCRAACTIPCKLGGFEWISCWKHILCSFQAASKGYRPRLLFGFWFDGYLHTGKYASTMMYLSVDIDLHISRSLSRMAGGAQVVTTAPPPLVIGVWASQVFAPLRPLHICIFKY